MSTQTEDQTKQAQTRAARLARVMEGYELDPSDPFDCPDPSVPGAARVEKTTQRYPCDVEAGKLVSHPRYVLVTQYGDRGDYRVHLAQTRSAVDQLAGYVYVAESGPETPICFYDLDQLAGPEPRPQEGDRVLYSEQELYVSWVREELIEGEVAYTYDLDPNPDADLDTAAELSVDPEEFEVIERAEEDERMPVRYGLAKVVVSVVFNTVPSP
jgi:hypothetical protein